MPIALAGSLTPSLARKVRLTTIAWVLSFDGSSGVLRTSVGNWREKTRPASGFTP